MIGIIFCLLGTWIILSLTKTKFSVLGLNPTNNRLVQAGAGFAFSCLAAVNYYLLTVWMLEASLEFNPEYSASELLEGAFWTLRSVLFEELIWRGILLYLIIKFIGVRTGIIISAITFGVYHWFSYEILGDYQQMIAVFMLTGIAGIMFGYAFALTGSLYLPVGLHFGWNFVSINIFSQGPLGNQLLLVNTTHQIEGISSLIFFLVQVFILPVIVMLYLYYLKKKQGRYLILS